MTQPMPFRFASMPLVVALAAAACADPTMEPPEEDFEVASIELTAASSVIVVGGTTQLTATAANAAGDDVTGTTEFVWSAEPASVLRTDQSGLVTGVSEGQGNVTVTADEVSETIEIEVAPPPAGD